MNAALHTPTDSERMTQLVADLSTLAARETLSDEAAEAIYALAHQALTQGHYDQAHEQLSLLTLYRPTHPTYLQALALCYRLRGQYEEAINLYAFLSATEPQPIEHDVAIAQCLLLQGDRAEAQAQIERLSAFCEENPGHAPIAQRTQALRELLAAQPTA